MATKKKTTDPLFGEDAATMEAIGEFEVAVILSVFKESDPHTMGGSMFDGFRSTQSKSIKGFYDMAVETAETDVQDAGGEDNADLWWVVWVCRDTKTLDVDLNHIAIFGGDKQWKEDVKKALVTQTKCFVVQDGEQPSWKPGKAATTDAAPAKKAPVKRGPVKKAAASPAPAEKAPAAAAKKSVVKRAASKAAVSTPTPTKKAAKPSPVSKSALAKKRAAKAPTTFTTP